MCIRPILKSIRCDLGKFNQLDDAFRSLIIDRKRPIFADEAMELAFSNLLREMREEFVSAWNIYNKKDC